MLEKFGEVEANVVISANDPLTLIIGGCYGKLWVRGGQSSSTCYNFERTTIDKFDLFLCDNANICINRRLTGHKR